MASSNLSFHGRTDSPLALALSRIADVSPAGGAASAHDASVIDGASHQLDEERLRAALAGGAPVILANAGEAQRDAVAALSGSTPFDALPLIIVRPGESGGYDVSALKFDVTGLDDDAAADVFATHIGAEAQPHENSGNLAAADGGLSLGGLDPAPKLVTWGKKKFRHRMPVRSILVDNDDVAMRATTQFGSFAKVELTMYVYWADGDPQNKAYYVINHIHGTFNPGTLVRDEAYCRAYFQHTVQIGVEAGVVRRDQVGNVEQYSPTGPQTGDVPVSVNMPLSLLASEGGGINAINFIATASATNGLTDWGINDANNQFGPWWTVHQVKPWNSMGKDFRHYDRFHSEMHAGENELYDLSALAKGTLTFDLFVTHSYPADWCDPGTRKLSFKTQFWPRWYVTMLHTPSSCGAGQHHAFLAGSPGFPMYLADYYYDVKLHDIAIQRYQS